MIQGVEFRKRKREEKCTKQNMSQKTELEAAWRLKNRERVKNSAKEKIELLNFELYYKHLSSLCEKFNHTTSSAFRSLFDSNQLGDARSAEN